MTRLRKSLLTVALLLGLALAAGLVWRHALAAAVLRLGLSVAGFGEAGFTEVETGWREVVIADLSLGPGLPSARAVRLRFAPTELAAGRVREVRIEGLRYVLPSDWRAALARLGGTPGGGGAGWIAVSRVELADALVTLAAVEGGTVDLEGALDLSGDRPGAVLEVGLALGGAEGRFTLRSDALGEGGAVEIAGSGKAALAGLSIPGGPGHRATAGAAELTLAGTLPIPAAEATGPASWLGQGLALDGELRLEGVTAEAAPGSLSADIAWTLSRAGDTLRLGLPRPARLDLRGISPDALERLQLAAGDARDLSVRLSGEGPVLAWSPEAGGGRAALAGDLRLALGDATAELRARASVRHDPSGRLSEPVELAFSAAAAGIGVSAPRGVARLRQASWTAAGSVGADGDAVLAGPLSAQVDDLSAAGLTADALALDGRARLSAGAGDWALGVEPDATLVAAGVRLPGRVRLDGPATVTFERLEVTGGEGAARLDLAARPSPLSGAVLEGQGREIAFTGAEGRFMLDLDLGAAVEGELRLAEGTAQLPGEAVRLDAVSGSLTLGGAPSGAALSLAAELRDTARQRRFAPVAIDLAGSPDGEQLALSGTLEVLGRGVRLPLKGSADLAQATGRLTAGPARLDFRPSGLQPGALSPLLAALGELSGPVGVAGTVAIGPGGALDTRLNLDLDGVAVRRGDLEVTGVGGRVVMSRVAPPATAGPQELRARRLVAGVPVENPRARFTLLPRSGGPLVQLHEGVAELAGGEVRVEETRWDPAAETNALEVRLRGVDLQTLLREWQVEGVSGTGRLSGVVPVRIGPAGLAISGGRLEAAGPGVIRVDWGAARQTLVGAGEEVALTVRALEDFHYEALSIGIERPPDGTLTLAVGLDGASPEVLDGYPFRFNISLSGRLEPILAALREGRRIGAELLEGGLGAGSGTPR